MQRPDPPAAARGLVVGDIGRHWSRLQPDAIALDDGHATLSFRQLDTRADRLAAHLVEIGVEKGGIVCVLLPNGIDYVVAVLAVVRAGAVLCPLNPRYTARELAGPVRVAKPAALLTSAAPHPAIGEEPLRSLCVETRVVAVDAFGNADPGLSSASLPAVGPDDLFSLMFTSGTTGEPKGALATHRGRMTWIGSAIAEYGLSTDEVYLGAMPMVHSAGLTMTLTHLHMGARVRLMPRFDAVEFLATIERERITSALAVPTMLSMLMAALDKTSCDLSSLRRLLTCGAPLPLATKMATLERLTPQLYDFYGSTESNSMTVLLPSDQMRKPRSVGRPFPNVEIMIAGPSGETLPAGEVGEIWSDNPSTMVRYLGLADATTAAFSGRWYRTGDLGYLDDEGYLHIVGRARELIISGGVNIFPPEIEGVLSEHPSVRDCAVVGVPNETWGQTVKAFIALKGDASLTLGEVQSHCCKHLADFKKPREIEIIAEIPRNAGGKIVKAALVGRPDGAAAESPR